MAPGVVERHGELHSVEPFVGVVRGWRVVGVRLACGLAVAVAVAVAELALAERPQRVFSTAPAAGLRSIAGMTSDGPIDLVLFDLAGVLIEPGGVEPMRELSGLGSEEEVWARWLGCRWVRSFEAGRCSPEEFAAGVVGDWELGLEPAAFLDEFARWSGLPYPGALDLVSEVHARVPVGCLSNTNALQWDANYRSTPLTDAFAYCFLSFELGLVKPDREIFEVVAVALPVSRRSVLFLDDNAVNIEAARAAGFTAEHVKAVDGARGALVRSGVLPV